MAKETNWLESDGILGYDGGLMVRKPHGNWGMIYTFPVNRGIVYCRNDPW